MNSRPATLTFVAVLLFGLACAGTGPLHAQRGTEEPQAPREFRAAWVTTLMNLDWPSRPGLSSAEQQRELIAILDHAAELNLNAVILQVRSMGEAFYDSRHAPWSHFLTGEMGRGPNPAWDPLEFAVREAHRRGLELHAWLNPYRVHNNVEAGGIGPGHISRTQPGIVRRYANLLWLDPTAEATRDHIMDVVLEVVRNYDIDGIQFDDYFYPWPRDGLDFPDDENWRAYRQRGGRMERGDWRRRHVDELIQRFYREVKQEDPAVKVGISPFGIWRPEHPEGIAGTDQYDVLYADPKKWLNQGWLDYLAPQLYWSTEQERQSYARLLAWWVSENTRNRHIWPGLATWKITASDWPVNEILKQIDLARRQRGATGHIHFRYAWLLNNRNNISTILKERAYPTPALVPASPWLGSAPPSRPEVALREGAGEGGHSLQIRSPEGENVRLWALYTRERDGWHFRQVLPANPRNQGTIRIPASRERITRIAVSAVDRVGNESEKAVYRLR